MVPFWVHRGCGSWRLPNKAAGKADLLQGFPKTLLWREGKHAKSEGQDRKWSQLKTEGQVLPIPLPKIEGSARGSRGLRSHALGPVCLRVLLLSPASTLLGTSSVRKAVRKGFIKSKLGFPADPSVPCFGPTGGVGVGGGALHGRPGLGPREP